jgi:hypothetical protein
MQMMQKMSWVHRVAGDVNEWESTVFDTVVMSFRSLLFYAVFGRHSYMNSACKLSQSEEEV